MIPEWVLFLLVCGLVFVSVEIGFRIGRAVRRKTEDERESPVSSISGVIISLLAFMLAFTFGIVFDRYDMKKSLVREEANAIRTTWNRADFLPDRSERDQKLCFRSIWNGESRSQAAVMLKSFARLWEASLTSSSSYGPSRLLIYKETENRRTTCYRKFSSS